MADKRDEFLRGFRLIRWELPLPPLHTHSKVALNWLLAGGRQTTNLFQRCVCAQRPWCLHITSEARQLTVGCGREPWWWTGHRCIPASTPLASSRAGRWECWEFSLLWPTQIQMLSKILICAHESLEQNLAADANFNVTLMTNLSSVRGRGELKWVPVQGPWFTEDTY